MRESKDKMGELKKRFEMAMEKLAKMKLEDFASHNSPGGSTPKPTEPPKLTAPLASALPPAATKTPEQDVRDRDVKSLALTKTLTSGTADRDLRRISKIPSIFAQFRTENVSPPKDNMLGSEPSSASAIPGAQPKLILTADAIKDKLAGALAQKVSRKQMQLMQSQKIQKVEEVLPQYEHHLRQLDAQFQEFMEIACEKFEKLEEEKANKESLDDVE